MFSTTLSCMAFLFTIIIVGWGLAKLKILPENSAVALSRLETYLFIPALVLGSFMKNFTRDSLGEMGIAFLVGLAFFAFSAIIAIVVGKLCAKEKYLQNLYIYGLAFANFGFVGNAVVTAVFPEYFPSYVMFTLPLWVGINLWGAPILLTEKKEQTEKQTFWQKVKSIINPLMVAMLIGMLLGVSGIKMPSFINLTVETLGNCMSPVAMLLTGITISEAKLLSLFKKVSVYVITAVRLFLIPLFVLLIIYLCKIPQPYACLITCASAMPLGLNVVVIPKSFGKDVSSGNSMVLVSHLISIVSVPLIFFIFNSII